jgi:hypothetical protein
MPSALTPGGADGRTRTGYVDPSHPMQEIGIVDPTRVQSGGYITEGQFDPAMSNLISAGTTFPPAQSRLPKVAVGVLLLLIATVGALLFRVTQTESSLPAPEPVKELARAAEGPIVVAPREAPTPLPPPPPPARPPIQEPPPPIVKRKVNPKPPPVIAPPPKPAGAHAELRAKLREVRKTRDRTAAIRLAVAVEKAGGRLPKGSEAAEAVSYEIGRIKYMTDVDDMIEALDRSLAALARAP